MVTMVWVVSRIRLKAPPGISSSCISPLSSSGQRSRASWASQPQKSATLSPQPGRRTTKVHTNMWWHWGRGGINNLKSTHLPYHLAIHPISIPPTAHLPVKHPNATSPSFHILIYEPPIRLQFLILFLPLHPPTALLKVVQQSNTTYICIKDINQLHVSATHLATIRL